MSKNPVVLGNFEQIIGATNLDTAPKTIMFIGSAASFMKHTVASNGYKAITISNIREARSALLETSFNNKENLPEAIFCDTQIDNNKITDFASYISISKDFKKIPFILFGKENEDIMPYVQSTPGIDDIIAYNTSFNDIIDKISLLKHYKSLKNKLPYKAAAKEDINNRLFESFFSRCIDIFFALFFLILLSPLLFIIAVAIKIDSRGSAFYISPRAGKGYKVFKFYKFRTMVEDADKKISQIMHLNQYNESDNKNIFIKIDNDPRVTRLGKFLRNSSLDELPQLFNVLLGDMSIVGNRPLPLYEACALTTDEFAERFLAPAGMTGLWQTNGRGHEKMSAEERINMDIDYAKKHSLLFDMYLLLRTPKGLIQKSDV